MRKQIIALFYALAAVLSLAVSPLAVAHFTHSHDGWDSEHNFRGSNYELYHTVFHGDLTQVKLLLAEGADPDSRALSVASERGHIEIVKLLLAAGVNPSPKVFSWNISTDIGRAKRQS